MQALDSMQAPVQANEFSALLTAYMRRIRASAGGLAIEIGMSREAVNNWRQGHSLPNRKHRARLLACTRYLRLTESETNRLLASAGFEPEFPLGERAPAAPYAAYIDELFARLRRLAPYPILMLLSQAHWGQPPFRETLLARARKLYGAQSVLHLQPPYSMSSEASHYFQAIGTQCDFADVDSDVAFEAALERRLAGGERLFCLVSRFEQGVPAQREALAGILRSLSEMYGGQLNLLLCGGEALAELKYQGGDLSLLNIASVEFWPELGAADVRELAQAEMPDIEVPDALAQRLLRASGGHPALVRDALAAIAADPAIDDAAIEDHLAANERIWQALLPLLAQSDTRMRLAERLASTQLGRARPYLLDKELRRLFWANLVVAREHAEGRMLEWRCEAVRRAGRLMLEPCAGS